MPPSSFCIPTEKFLHNSALSWLAIFLSCWAMAYAAAAAACWLELVSSVLSGVGACLTDFWTGVLGNCCADEVTVAPAPAAASLIGAKLGPTNELSIG